MAGEVLTMTRPGGPTEYFPFDNSYARLPERFFVKLPPTPVKSPRLTGLADR